MKGLLFKINDMNYNNEVTIELTTVQHTYLFMRYSRPSSAGNTRLPSPAMGRKYTNTTTSKTPTSPQMSVRNKTTTTSSSSSSAPLSRQNSRYVPVELCLPGYHTVHDFQGLCGVPGESCRVGHPSLGYLVIH